jgi:hypothetical protein
VRPVEVPERAGACEPRAGEAPPEASLDAERELGQILGNRDDRRRRSAVGVAGELSALGPVLVVHLVDEHLDLRGAESVGIDERLGYARHETAFWFEVARRLLDCHDWHGQRPFGGWGAALALFNWATRRAAIFSAASRLLATTVTVWAPTVTVQ